MNWRIGEILIQKKLIDWNQLGAALEEQKKTKEYLGEILVREHDLPRSLFYKALAEQHGMDYIHLSRTHINADAVARIPASIARKYGMMPVDFIDDTLAVGISDPAAAWPEAQIAGLAGVGGIRRVLCLPEEVAKAHQEYYHE